MSIGDDEQIKRIPATELKKRINVVNIRETVDRPDGHFKGRERGAMQLIIDSKESTTLHVLHRETWETFEDGEMVIKKSDELTPLLALDITVDWFSGNSFELAIRPPVKHKKDKYNRLGRLINKIRILKNKFGEPSITFPGKTPRSEEYGDYYENGQKVPFEK